MSALFDADVKGDWILGALHLSQIKFNFVAQSWTIADVAFFRLERDVLHNAVEMVRHQPRVFG